MPRGETVVRLKNGAPLIFGRAAEEMEALRQARIVRSRLVYPVKKPRHSRMSECLVALHNY